MARTNRVRLSNGEIETVKATRQLIYEDTSVPMGVVVKRACEALITDSNDEMEVQF